MAGDTVFGDGFHLPCADLHFDRYAVHAEKGRVQRLIAVGLRDCDVVLETAGDRFVEVVNYAKHAVAGIDSVHDDAKAKYVHDFFERFALTLHLFVDGVDVFFPARDDSVDAFAT
jgi:hypothetical protein